MKLLIVLFSVGFLAKATAATVVNGGKEIFCVRAAIAEVRIEGCDAEPCVIQKGATVPFQIDLTFQVPAQSTDFSVSVFNPYWNVPGTGAYGGYIGRAAGCEELQTCECPLSAGTTYTISSSIYIDPESKDSLNGADTGSRSTGWMLNVFGADRKESSSCSFNVKIQIEEA